MYCTCIYCCCIWSCDSHVMCVRVLYLESPVDLPEFNEKLRLLFPHLTPYIVPSSW